MKLEQIGERRKERANEYLESGAAEGERARERRLLEVETDVTVQTPHPI